MRLVLGKENIRISLNFSDYIDPYLSHYHHSWINITNQSILFISFGVDPLFNKDRTITLVELIRHPQLLHLEALCPKFVEIVVGNEHLVVYVLHVL